MQLGSALVPRTCPFNRNIPCTFSLSPRLAAPPVVALPQQVARNNVVVQAKRTKKSGTSRSEDASGIDAGGAPSGWDAALANIPTRDEASSASNADQSTSTQPQVSDYAPVDDESAASATTSRQLEDAAAADRSGDQRPDPSQPAPSTSKGADSSLVGPPKKPPSTLITLTEFALLMEAKEIREKELIAKQEREAREKAGLSGLAVQEPAPLVIGRQGFQVFELDGGDLELLVAESSDGQLALADSYVATKGSGGAGGEQMQYARPTLVGPVPSAPAHYQVIPWAEQIGGDLFKFKESTQKIRKVYFIGVHPSPSGGFDDPIMDLEAIFQFDGKSCTLSHNEVRVVGTPPILEPVLRIRPTGLTLEEAYLMPDPIEVSMDTGVDLADMSPEEWQERMAELDRQAEELDELDEAPDVPSVDNM
ncbi:hypothetical protein Agub_g7878 [Astrephomene gubernaculifera]|uniref:Uncharacterized protein n=1 Tax=Astrephomene gubernaculifera TaxID=47775 RepID=A0AAD3DTE8_9CHLO|nr:hypothetical protein Agub_g7878 [Astrephomene gubernaculifera]